MKTRAAWGYAAFIALLAAVPLAAPQFWVTLGNYIGLYSIVALGLVLLTGVAGQTSFGQAAFVGIGEQSSDRLGQGGGIAVWEGRAARSDRFRQSPAGGTDHDATACNSLQGDNAERLLPERRHNEDLMLLK